MSLHSTENEIVTPGELLASGDFKAGDGVIRDGENYYSSVLGVFAVKNDRLLVRSLKGRYYPQVGDTVIAYVEEANLTSWMCTIHGPYTGVLLASNAVRGRFDPVKDDARRIFDIGDVIKAEIVSFDRTRDPQLTTKFPGLGKLEGGRVLETNPNHIPRIIGRKGSMISLIKNATGAKIVVGKNGRVWIKADSHEQEDRVIEAIQQISREAHVSGLTNRITELLTGEKPEED